MGGLSEPPVHFALRALSHERRCEVAVAMAEIVEPLAELASLTPQPLSRSAERIRSAPGVTEARAEAAALSAIPALQKDEEPDDLAAWFSLGAVVAWIYAGDTFGDPTGQRAVNTFARVDDVLDYAEELLDRPGLCDRLYGAVTEATRGDDTELRAMRGLGQSLLSSLRGLT